MPSSNEWSLVSTMLPELLCTSNRRQFLSYAGLTLLGGTAGCTAVTGNDAESGPYTALEQTDVYVGPDVDLEFPAAVPRVATPDDAGLIFLAEMTDTGATQVIDWLSTSTVLAIYGDDPQAIWLTWAGSEAYADSYEPAGIAEGEPAPALVIAWDSGSHVTTSQFGWSGGPDEHDIFEALDKTLAEITMRHRYDE